MNSRSTTRWTTGHAADVRFLPFRPKAAGARRFAAKEQQNVLRFSVALVKLLHKALFPHEHRLADGLRRGRQAVVYLYRKLCAVRCGRRSFFCLHAKSIAHFAAKGKALLQIPLFSAQNPPDPA